MISSAFAVKHLLQSVFIFCLHRQFYHHFFFSNQPDVFWLLTIFIFRILSYSKFSLVISPRKFHPWMSSIYPFYRHDSVILISFVFVQRTSFKSSCSISTPESTIPTITGNAFYLLNNSAYALSTLIPGIVSSRYLSDSSVLVHFLLKRLIFLRLLAQWSPSWHYNLKLVFVCSIQD
jgi:hypothetical protein